MATKKELSQIEILNEKVDRILQLLEGGSSGGQDKSCWEEGGPPPSEEDLEPITKESLLADNQWMMRCAAALGSGGIYQITPILEKYGVRSIHQIGDNAEVLSAVKAEIAALFPEGEVPR